MEAAMKKLRIKTFRQLPKKILFEVKRFVSNCQKQEGYESVFYWSSIQNRRNPGIHEIICYADADAEDKRLVAYIALYHFEEKEVEISVLVHPDYRQADIYSILLEEIKRIVSSYGIEILYCIFICNQKSLFFREYLSSVGARCLGYTYKLSLTSKDFRMLPKPAASDLEFESRIALASDLEQLIELQQQDFSASREDAQAYIMESLEDPTKEIFLMLKEGNIIGKVQVHQVKSDAFLYDLCIAKSEQGKGRGSALLYRVLLHLFQGAVKKIRLDATEKRHLDWYENFHFKCESTQEHWRVSALKGPEKHLAALMLHYNMPDQCASIFYKH